MKYGSVLFFGVCVAFSTACQNEDSFQTQLCSRFESNQWVVSVDEVHTLWPCFSGMTLTVSGYLAHDETFDGFYQLYESADAFKFGDKGNMVSVEASDKWGAGIKQKITKEQAIRVRLTAKHHHMINLHEIQDIGFGEEIVERSN